MSYNDSRTLMRFRTTENKKGRELIKQDSSCVLEYEVTYRLYQLRKSGSLVYRIYAGYRRDRVYCFAGNNRSAAQEIFDTVVRGCVTPCTLQCIIDDLLPEYENAEQADGMLAAANG